MIPLDPSAGVRAAQAEADRVRAIEEAEEEAMTPYSAADLAAGCEFKIIRSPRKLFGRPDYRDRVLAEEAQAGWELVEVFDHARIRLKRAKGSRPAPPDGYDPYRTVLDESGEPRTPAEKAAAYVGLGGLLALVIIVVIALVASK